MRVVADFLIAIGAMLLTGTFCIIAIAVGRVPAQDEPIMVIVVMAAMAGALMFTAGILVHLRKWQKD